MENKSLSTDEDRCGHKCTSTFALHFFQGAFSLHHPLCLLDHIRRYSLNLSQDSVFSRIELEIFLGIHQPRAHLLFPTDDELMNHRTWHMPSQL